MFDDHDIFDGWGSYDPPLQLCPVFQVRWAPGQHQMGYL